MNMAHKNRWVEKLRVLAEPFLANTCPDVFTADEFIKAANTNQRPTFAKFWHYIRENAGTWRGYRPVMAAGELSEEKDFVIPEGTIKITKKLLQQPIETQPWFFGNLSPLEIKGQLANFKRNDVFFVTFYGSRLYYHQHSKKKRGIDKENSRKLPVYAIPNQQAVKDFELYQFYLLLISHDLEGMKTAQNTHNFAWDATLMRRDPDAIHDSPLIGSQPHPLNEYLNVVDDIRQDVVDWLFELCPLKGVSFDWERNVDIPDSHLQIIRKVIERGGTISTKLWMRYMIQVFPTKRNELIMLANAWNDFERSIEAWQFLFERYSTVTYSTLCKQRKMISETKMTVLLAWKHAQGESIGFRNLPKELIQLVVGFIDEPSPPTVFAKILAECRKRSIIPHHIVGRRCDYWFNDNLWAVEFVSRNGDLVGESIPRTIIHLSRAWRPWTLRIVKIWLAELSIKTGIWASNFLKVLYQTETDLPFLEKIWPHLTKTENIIRPIRDVNREKTLQALKAQNRVLLKFLMTKSEFVMPSELEYNSYTLLTYDESIAKNSKMTYDEAVALVAELTTDNAD